jgi:hypothetical protein
VEIATLCGVVKGLLAAIVFVLAAVATLPSSARADEPIPSSVALMGFDALGMDDERVLRLETLFLKELERLTKNKVPSRREVAGLKRRLRRCDGNNRCLSAIGRALDVDVVVSGNVAALGDSYVLNIKAVHSKGGDEIRRIESDPLRGQPDELIEAIRVAAYRLLAPDELKGSVAVLADRDGAKVELDGKVIGTTPLKGPITGLPLGEHSLTVSAEEFGEFTDKVRVRFQKTTRVAVSLVDLRVRVNPDPNDMVGTSKRRPPPPRWYESTWFYVGVGVGAAIIGGYVGYQLGKPELINCQEDPGACMP